MVRPFFRNIRLLVLTIILIVGWGLSSYQSLPRQEDPELVSRVGVITTAFPGASAERVEALVTTVLEEELAEIEEIDTLSSTSRVGFSSITVELEETVMDAQPVWSKVRDKMDDAAQLFPPGTTDPDLTDVLVKAYTFVASVTWDLEGDPNYAILRRYAKELGVALRGTGGVEAVDMFGDPTEEILVEIDAPALVGVGLSPQALATQISLSDAKTSSGQLRTAGQSVAIEVENELQTLEQIRQIPIQTSQGQFTRLSDIAAVSRGIRDPQTHIAIINGKPAVVLGVMMQSGLRIDQWATQARRVVNDFRARLPNGIQVDVIFDQSGYVETRLSALMFNLVISALLVIGVTLVAMGWRSALIVGSALPLTICVVFGVMTVLGVPIHQMSVTGLIIALGLLIDNAIVVVDEVQMEIAHGRDPLSAAVKTVNYLKVPLLASTVTTILTFLPIYLLPGPAGEFVGTIALGVILALIGSLAISLTLIAALAARVLGSRHHQQRHGYPDSNSNSHGSLGIPKPWWEKGISLPGLARPYAWSVARATTKPVLALVLTLSIPIAGFALAGSLDSQFFPSLDRDQFHIEMEFSSQIAIQETREQVLRARDVILAHDEVEEVYWFVGQSAPRFYYNLQGGRENEPNYAQAMVQLKSQKGVEVLARRLQEELDQQFPLARVMVQKFEQGPPFDAPVEMRIYGSNLAELRRLGLEVREMLTGIPGVTHVRDALTEGQPKLGIYLDPEQVRQAGLTNTEIAQQLEAYSEGVTGGSILESTEDLPIRVRLANADRASLQALASLDLRPDQAQDRGFRPLSTLGNFELVPQLTQITRRNEQRVNTVQAFLSIGILPSTALSALQERLEQANFQLPPGYRYEFGGEAEQQGAAQGNLLLFLPLLVLGMVIALVLSLGSFRLAAIIGVVAISSIGMALLSLSIFGSVLGFTAIIGTMGLIGLGINDSIVVLTAFGEDPDAKLGDPRAVQGVVIKATRHVLTTTATTIIGFVPLLWEGDPFWMPLSLSIAGGMVGTTLMALYFIPAAYVLIKGWKPKREDPGVRDSCCSVSVPASTHERSLPHFY